MIEEVVFARGAWWPRHRPDPDCWCRPSPYEQDARLTIHRRIVAPSPGKRAFMSGVIQGPV